MTFDFAPIKEAAENGLVSMTFYKVPDASYKTSASTWPVEGTTIAHESLPAGDYYVVVTVGNETGEIVRCMTLGENGWTYMGDQYRNPEPIKATGKPITVEAGKTLEISNEGFGELAIAQLNDIAQQ